MSIIVEHLQGDSFEVLVGGHRIVVDQPGDSRDVQHCTVHNSLQIPPTVSITVGTAEERTPVRKVA